MHKMNGSHQPSVDEILASIRASIAEEAAVEITRAEPRYRFTPLHTAPANDEEPGEFELPSMFKPAPNAAPEKHTRLFGRLTDALKNAVPEQGFAAKITSLSETTNATAPNAVASNGSTMHGGVRSAAPIAPASSTTDALAAATGNEEVKRVMVPFKDTTMCRMGELSAKHSATMAPAPVEVPVTPQPSESLASGSWAGTFPQPRAQAPQPAPSFAKPATDFGAIVPGRYDAPYAPQHEPVPPMAHNPMPTYHPAPQYQAPLPPQPDHGYAHVPHQSAHPVDDAAAQLLRPMLRQWLSDNMPKIVEKALLSEVTEGGPPSNNKNGHNH